MLFISAVFSAHKIEMIYKLNLCISHITCLQAIVKVNELIIYFMLTFNISITCDQIIKFFSFFLMNETFLK
jgi:hypothetical protein